MISALRHAKDIAPSCGKKIADFGQNSRIKQKKINK